MKKNQSKVSPGDSQRSKIQKLMFFRAVVVTLLLGATAMVQVKENYLFPYSSSLHLYTLIGFTYLLTIVYAILLNRVKPLKILALAQILVDVIFCTSLIYFTGGIESIFSWVYLLSVFSASIILFRNGGLLIATASSLLYGTLLVLQYYQIILPLGSRLAFSTDYNSRYVYYLIAMNMLAFYLMAILSAYLSEQIRRKESELKERLVDYAQLERLYKHIVQNVVSGLVTIDEKGRVTSFNRMAQEITGYELEEVYRKRIEDVFPGILSLSKAAEWSQEKGWKNLRVSRREAHFQKKDGTILTLGVSVSPLKDSDNLELGSVLIFQDLTQLREMEEELKLADRLAAVGALAAGMAHEIRNPMASISGSVEILKDMVNSSAQAQHLMDIILREINRLNALLSDFLLYARPIAPGKEIIRINEIIQETLNIFSHSPECSSNTGFRTIFHDDLSMAGEAKHIRQIFWNLFINAAQAMPKGGELLVESRLLTPNAILGQSAGQGEIIFSDTGRGIDEKCLDKIFDPFFTSKEGGTGLGLSIVHRIVQSYGGKIMVRSQLGKGTTFTIHLPVQ